uniref:Uncharacterized protein n=1 Tax=Hyaloperonospora arabidopsidis (strain Emoy2) TaxID=559515 RepID=M4B450_HYAAE
MHSAFFLASTRSTASTSQCLVMGIKPRSGEKQPSWWHVLYASTLIVEEPTLVQSVVSAAFLAETDAGKARCWLKIALNNHTIESSIMRPETPKLLDALPGPERTSEDLMFTITDADIAAAVGVSAPRAGSLPETEPVFTENKDSRNETQGAATVMRRTGNGCSVTVAPTERCCLVQHVSA